MENYSLSDLSAATGGGGFGGNSAWVLIILFAMIFGGNGLFGNRGGEQFATSADVQRATDFSAIERQMNEGVAATRQGVYDTTGAIKDGNYNILGELRDLQAETARGFGAVNSELAAGFSNMQNCCCEIQRGIDSVNYNGAINTAQITAAVHAEGEATRNMFQADKIATLQNQLNQSQIQNYIQQATCGVVKYPTASTYYAGNNPFCNCSCGCV